jgi:hypothetical protein
MTFPILRTDSVELLIAWVNHRQGRIAANKKSGNAGSGLRKMTPTSM